MLELFLLCILAAPLAIGRATNKTLPNVGYITKGYNAFKGNPNSDLVDPGYTVSIFQISYEKVSKIFTHCNNSSHFTSVEFSSIERTILTRSRNYAMATQKLIEL